MKRLFAILLILVLCVPTAMVCAEKSEPEKYTSGDWKYILLEDGTADITWYKKEAPSVEIPEEIDGHPVTISSTNPFIMCKTLSTFTVAPNHPTLATIDGVLFNKAEKKLVAYPQASTAREYAVPEGILAIGDSAFRDCTSLANITLPESVTSIGSDAFYGCSSLTGIKLPESVTSIGDYAFASCDSLTSITLPESVTSIGSGAFAFSKSLIEICVSPDNPAFAVIDGVLFDKAGESLVAFLVGDVRTEYTVPDGVVYVGGGAFAGCDSLTSITLPESVTSIGKSAFSCCTSLTDITIPESVTSIGESAFFGCYSLTSITLPESVTSIGEEAFAVCYSLTSITLPESVTSIGEEAFAYCYSLTSITLPESLTSIGDDVLYYCESLQSVRVAPDSYAEAYCKDNDLPIAYIENTDWLNG